MCEWGKPDLMRKSSGTCHWSNSCARGVAPRPTLMRTLVVKRQTTPRAACNCISGLFGASCGVCNHTPTIFVSACSPRCRVAKHHNTPGRSASVSASRSWRNGGGGFAAAAGAPRNRPPAARAVPSRTIPPACAGRSRPNPRPPWRPGGSGAPPPRGRRSAPRRGVGNANGSSGREKTGAPRGGAGYGAWPDMTDCRPGGGRGSRRPTPAVRRGVGGAPRDDAPLRPGAARAAGGREWPCP